MPIGLIISEVTASGDNPSVHIIKYYLGDILDYVRDNIAHNNCLIFRQSESSAPIMSEIFTGGLMTAQDAALQECFLAHRPVSLFVYKAGLLIRL